MKEAIVFLESNLERIAEEVHNAWWEEKKQQGFHSPVRCPQYPSLVVGRDEGRKATFSKHCDKCHPGMYPYNDLSDEVKKYDRVTVCAVIGALKE